MSEKINVKGVLVSFKTVNKEDFISLTDIAKYKNSDAPADIVKNWLRSKNTMALLGLWERLYNPNFKLVEFDQFISDAGYNYFVMSPKFIEEGFSQSERLIKLNQTAINQMRILVTKNNNSKLLGDHK